MDPLRNFDSDEAVVGLMARDIIRIGYVPVYYAGQGYMGALEAWCVAVSFIAFGESAASLRLVPFLCSLAFLVVLHRLLRRFFSSAASAVILIWTAIGTPYLNLWFVKARGGFAETLLIGAVFLLLFDSAWLRQGSGMKRLVVLGAVSGFGMFVNPLFGLVMAAPLLLLAGRAVTECSPLLPEDRRRIVTFLRFDLHSSGRRIAFRLLWLVGVLILFAAGVLLLVGDAPAEKYFGIRLPKGTTLAFWGSAFLGCVYTGALGASLGIGSLGRLVRKAWEHSTAVRILAAIGGGHLAVSLMAIAAVECFGGGGECRAPLLAPVLTWPKQAWLVFGELVPRAFWRPAWLTGPMMIGICVVVGVLLVRMRPGIARTLIGPDRIPALVLFGGATLVMFLLIMSSAYTFSAAPSARYLLPLFLCLPATAYLLVEKLVEHLGSKRVYWVLFALLPTALLVAGALRGPSSLWSAGGSSSPFPPLLDEFESVEARKVVGDYSIVYPLEFLSGGEVTVVPTDGVNRFPDALKMIWSDDPDAFIFREGTRSLARFKKSPKAEGRIERLLTPVAGGTKYRVYYPILRDNP
jgi:hypothetical protein